MAVHTLEQFALDFIYKNWKLEALIPSSYDAGFSLSF